VKHCFRCRIFGTEAADGAMEIASSLTICMLVHDRSGNLRQSFESVLR
jgi:hypothetical protein